MSTTPTKSLGLHQEIIDLKRQSYRKTILKSLLALVALVASVAAIVFLDLSYMPYAVALILLSSVAIYEYFTHHRNTSKIYSRAAKAIGAPQ